ncbi:MAG: adenylyltransferase/cytidyltransferase family protein [Desulfovibrionales bacterium]|nr:adenylyltransferase/cytidyltransferase family protein [Desulfovibrionales bacterium]
MKGLTVGVFDVFHLGHLRMLKKAKKYCDNLIVAVHNDKLNSKNVEFAYTLEERMEIVAAIKYVDQVIPYDRVDLIIREVDFDIFLYGPDQAHKYFQQAFSWCTENNKKITMLERTKGISSTMLRKVLSAKEV